MKRGRRLDRKDGRTASLEYPEQQESAQSSRPDHLQYTGNDLPRIVVAVDGEGDESEDEEVGAASKVYIWLAPVAQ